MTKPFSQACENNKEAIRQVLAPYIQQGGRLLEIGSGTGQHGAYISLHHPQLSWQTSDRSEYLAGINLWVKEAQRVNFKPPIVLDVNTAVWTEEKVDFLYSANTVHIMSWEEVRSFFRFIPSALKNKGYFFLYGPFNYAGKFTSESNARFNDWLRSQAPHRAIRDFEALAELAHDQGIKLVADKTMPANNRLLIWRLDKD